MKVKSVLDALNFSLAGAREGFGPFLGVYLQSRGYDPAATGLLMSIAGIGGLLATAPIGALIDRLEHKRAALVAAVMAIAVGGLIIVLTRPIWAIGAGQILIGVGDTAIAPLVAAMTLGVVGQAAFGARTARNDAFNHAGNAANAALAAALGYAFGLGWVVLSIVVMAVASSLTVGCLRPETIDHVEARSGETDERSTFRALLSYRRLLLFGAVVMLFQTANGAMLPFLAQARTAAGNDPSLTTGAMTVLARVSMVGAATLAPVVAARRGYAGVMTFALVAVIVRGVLASYATSWAMILPVQLLEGVAMGLGGVALPALNAEIMVGTGRVNAGLGFLLMTYGLGSTFSPLVAGFLAQKIGFYASFRMLSVIAAVGLVLWLVARSGHVALRFASTPSEAAPERL